MIPFGKAAVRRDGTDVVVVTWGALVQRSLVAAQQAEQDGHQRRGDRSPHHCAVRLGDDRRLHVKRTNRVVVAHEDQLTCGFGAEIAARIADELFEYLDAPVKRVGALDTPVAYSPVLEDAILPQIGRVLAAIRSVAKY